MEKEKGSYDFRKIWSKKNDELAAHYFFRVVAYPFSAFLIKYTAISPNTITVIGFLFGMISISLYLRGTFENIVPATIFAFLFSLCDNIDGDIARVKNLKSDLGKWLDGITGYITIPFLLFAIGFGLHTRTAMIFSALAMISFPLQHTMIYFFKFYFSRDDEQEALIPQNQKTPKKRTLLAKILEKLRTAYGAAFFFTALTLFMIFQKPLEFLIFQALIGNLFWISIIFLEYKKLHQEVLPGREIGRLYSEKEEA